MLLIADQKVQDAPVDWCAAPAVCVGAVPARCPAQEGCDAAATAGSHSSEGAGGASSRVPVAHLALACHGQMHRWARRALPWKSAVRRGRADWRCRCLLRPPCSPHCKKAVCAACGVLWHAGLTCTQYQVGCARCWPGKVRLHGEQRMPARPAWRGSTQAWPSTSVCGAQTAGAARPPVARRRCRRPCGALTTRSCCSWRRKRTGGAAPSAGTWWSGRKAAPSSCASAGGGHGGGGGGGVCKLVGSGAGKRGWAGG